jgi:UDP-N-acetylglucosamine 4-epimerase
MILREYCQLVLRRQGYKSLVFWGSSIMEIYSTSYHGEENLANYSFLVTGGAGFIGSNSVEYLLKYGAGKVRVLDNLSTGFKKNIDNFFSSSRFEFLEGDIRDLGTCTTAMKGIHYVFHEAALGSVPRSITDPLTTNEVNIGGFLNILISARNEKVRRVIYAASSSTYGDSTELPKVEHTIGKPLSPYAITKYVNELYAEVFFQLYGMELVGLRYFNVFGQRQDPNGSYAAVIPKFVNQYLNYKSPIINGDGTYSRDFTYIENVIQMNMKAAFSRSSNVVNQIFNVAVGESTSLYALANLIKGYLSKYDPAISEIQIVYGPTRLGDIPHSLASIEKAKAFLNYTPGFTIKTGLAEAIQWYIDHRPIQR